jgi:MFS family permease
MASSSPAQLPTWWLLFQQTFWLPQFLGFALVPNILLPMQVTALAGESGEGSGLAVVSMLIQVSGFTMPFIGAWSDRTHKLLGVRGARRPFILYGQLGVLLSIVIMMRATNIAELALGNFLFSALNNLPTTVYAAVLPELVPPGQRGKAASFQMLMVFR